MGRRARASMTDRAPCRPTLYVYPVPAAFRVSPHGANSAGDDLDWAFGRVLGLSRQAGLGLTIRDQNPHMLPAVLYHRALSYRCRVRSAAAADIYFVPAFRTLRPQHPPQCAEPASPNASRDAFFDKYIQREASAALRARGGADHFMMNARTGNAFSQSAGKFCEYDESDGRWGSATRLALEQGGNYSYPSRHGKALALYHSVPYPSIVPLLLTPVGGPPPWRSNHERDVFVAGSFGHRANMGAFPLRLRDKLRSRCSDANSSCTLLPTSAGAAKVAALFWRASFCLQPYATQGSNPRLADPSLPLTRLSLALDSGGDTISRKSIVDALLLGCVPVLFHPGQRMQACALCHSRPSLSPSPRPNLVPCHSTHARGFAVALALGRMG